MLTKHLNKTKPIINNVIDMHMCVCVCVAFIRFVSISACLIGCSDNSILVRVKPNEIFEVPCALAVNGQVSCSMRIFEMLT